MDPLTFALISGGAGFLGSKLAGMSTKDAFRQGILSGGLSFLTPAATLQSLGTKQGLQTLLTGAVKQGVAGRIGKKLGVNPELAMLLGSQVNIPGLPGGTVPSADNMVLNANTMGVDNVNAMSKASVPDMRPIVDYDDVIGNKASDYLVNQGTSNISSGTMDTLKGLLKTKGEYDINKIAKATTLFGVPALLYASGAFKPQPTTMYAPSYNVNYPELREARGGMQRINPITGITEEVTRQDIPEELYADQQPYKFTEQTFYPRKYQTGGLASFSEGGVNYLPSKTTHDEKDAHNYKRAAGYIEDGAGNGDKDEDTMLAQLADGEFVTRTDGVLGAGILAGANPKDEKDMRAKGAKYFYEQQARFKRIFDLLNANRASQLH